MVLRPARIRGHSDCIFKTESDTDPGRSVRSPCGQLCNSLQAAKTSRSTKRGSRHPKKNKATVPLCELNQTSNLPKHSRRTDPLTSSTHAEPEDHKANSGCREQIYPCTLERLTAQPQNLSNRHVQSVDLASLSSPSLFDCTCAAQQTACTSLHQHSAVVDAPPRTAL